MKIKATHRKLIKSRRKIITVHWKIIKNITSPRKIIKNQRTIIKNHLKSTTIKRKSLPSASSSQALPQAFFQELPQQVSSSSNLPPQEAQLCHYQHHFFIEFLTCVVWPSHPGAAFTHCFIALTEHLLNKAPHDDVPMIFSDLKAQCKCCGLPLTL